MDFRDSLVVCSTSVTAAASSFGDKGEFGSGFLKQQGERSISEGHHQMLTFSSPNLHTTPSFPYYHNASARITGMNQTLAGLKVPFTPSQWMELEHQALIYKYITSNVPIPSYLLNPIRKAFESAGFSTQRSNPLGWGGFHLGFSSSDPEPGRCRRTDGKKWRCSREAVLDQKYCERHINRGRHRSRKPVEAQSGRAASRAPIASTAAANGVAPGGAASTLSLSRRHQLKNLQEEQQQPGSVANFNRSIPNKENNSYPLQELGLVCSDSLISSLDRSSSLLHCRRFGDSDNPNDQDNNKWENHSLRQFMNYSDRTQLSISIPMSAASDFMPFALSPKLQRSPQELEMVLQVGTTPAEHNQRQVFPISWEPSSIAGPLGEALRSTSNIHCDSLNMKHNWDNSPHLAASPTGVLQKGAFVSLSNSSAGSSPRGESIKIPDGDSRSDGIITGL